MNTKFTLLPLALLLLNLSCINRDNDNNHHLAYVDFPETISVQSEVLELGEGSAFVFPSDIEVVEEDLFILDRELPDSYVKRYNRHTRELIGSYGRQGRSSEEFRLPEKMVADGNSLKIFDAVSPKFVQFDLQANSIKDVVNLNSRTIPMLGATLIKDSLIAFSDITSNKLLVIQDFNGQIVDSVMVEYKRDLKSTREDPYQLFDVKIAYDDASNTLVAASKLNEMICIYDLNTKGCRVVVGPIGVPQMGSEESMEDILGTHSGFLSVKIHENKIYALFSGESMDKYMSNSIYGAFNIYVFDMEGNPIQHLKLDQPTAGFAIYDDLLYLINVNSEHPISISKI